MLKPRSTGLQELCGVVDHSLKKKPTSFYFPDFQEKVKHDSHHITRSKSFQHVPRCSAVSQSDSGNIKYETHLQLCLGSLDTHTFSFAWQFSALPGVSLHDSLHLIQWSNDVQAHVWMLLVLFVNEEPIGDLYLRGHAASLQEDHLRPAFYFLLRYCTLTYFHTLCRAHVKPVHSGMLPCYQEKPPCFFIFFLGRYLF